VVKILGSDSLYFSSYRLWKLGFFTSPKTSLKQVFLVKLSYLKARKSKLSATSFIGKNITIVFQVQILEVISKKLDTWHSIQVHSLERAKNQQVLGKLP
jgi:hypothetical protein